MYKYIPFALALIFVSHLKADAVYDVSVNTSALIANVHAPFALDFQLTSGDASSGVVNTATLSDFAFGAGGSVATGQPFSNSGNASGGLGSEVVLSTTGGVFFNEFSQFFQPGTLLSFHLDLTNHAEAPPTPDEFTFQMIDNTGTEIPTTDPSGSNSLLVVDLLGSPLQFQDYATNGDGISVSPQVTSVVATTPEVSTFLITGFGLLVLISGRKLWATLIS